MIFHLKKFKHLKLSKSNSIFKAISCFYNNENAKLCRNPDIDVFSTISKLST